MEKQQGILQFPNYSHVCFKKERLGLIVVCELFCICCISKSLSLSLPLTRLSVVKTNARIDRQAIVAMNACQCWRLLF